MGSVRVNCKINLGLYIVRKRPDGYHDLETVFYPTDFFSDTLTTEPSARDLEFVCRSPWDTGADSDNLCVKAFRMLQKDYGIHGVRMVLEKGIPIGAGLGGGSADAAFALKALAQHFGLPLTLEQLHHYAAELGSDVPFFIHNSPMYATGRGEILTPVSLDLSDYRIEIVKPDVSVSTKEAYAGITPRVPVLHVADIIQHPVEEWRGLLHNDFEESIFQRHPVLADLKAQMYAQGAVYAAMTGSGTAIFGLFPKKRAAL
ncbi:MAG: 4-(cytidine 5'-diphospho)-2-C-methyl-D-erythritol kinase [Bacteroidales bacterium]|nr:4-(cytidine 5'-diphospho)-2-C-methyl-D-erythritol kinase [Bacteroidales bacterium]